MKKYLINSLLTWQVRKKEIMGVNQELASLTKEPSNYPCIVIVAYLGEGWDEIDFIYTKDWKL